MIKYHSISAILLLIAACSIDTEAFAPTVPADQLMSRLKLEFNSYNIATAQPYNTVQLRAFGITGKGDTIEPTKLTYSVSNQNFLEVNSTGLLRAVAPTAVTVVRVESTLNGVTLIDSAFVNIVDGTPAAFPARISFQVLPGDSAKYAVGGVGARNKLIGLVRSDSSDNNLATLRVSISSKDTLIAKAVQSGGNVAVTPVNPGKTTLYVSTYAYGLTFMDSIAFVSGWPIMLRMNVYERYPFGSTIPVLDFAASKVTIGVGGCVSWRNIRLKDLDIQFDSAQYVVRPTGALCESDGIRDLNGGNISPFPGVDSVTDIHSDIYMGIRTRTFIRPGTYRYFSEIHGTSGEIVVCNEDGISSCSPENYKWGSY